MCGGPCPGVRVERVQLVCGGARAGSFPAFPFMAHSHPSVRWWPKTCCRSRLGAPLTLDTIGSGDRGSRGRSAPPGATAAEWEGGGGQGFQQVGLQGTAPAAGQGTCALVT